MRFALPDGWKILDDSTERIVIVSAPLPPHGAVFVSIDFADRCYRAGVSSCGAPVTRQKYTGRGWSERLFADAVAWLRGVIV